MAEEEKQEEKKKGGGGTAKIAILALIVCNVLALGGLFAFVAMGSSKDEVENVPLEADKPQEGEAAEGEKKDEGAGEGEGEAAAAEDEEPEKKDDEKKDDDDDDLIPNYRASDLGPTVKLGEFVINLNNPGQSRYLKLSLKVELDEPSTKGELRVRDAQLRDLIISYLSNLAIKDTYGARAKAVIRDNIRRRMNQILTSGEVKRVFFIEFMTQ